MSSTLLFYLQTLLSVILIIVVILYPRPGGDNATRVSIVNPTESDVALCWLSTYVRENELLEKAPEGCYRIRVGVNKSFTLNTFEGHRFILVPWDKPSANSGSPSRGFLHITHGMTDYTVDFHESALTTLREMKNLTDVWQQLLRNRHYVMIFVVCVYAIILQLTNSTIPHRRRIGLKKRNEDGEVWENLLIPRHNLKCFAVLNMVLNHLSYMFFQNDPKWQYIGTLPADLIGSAQIFWFLVGCYPNYSRTSHVRTNSTMLLLVFILLEHYCRLPKPFTYETLFTIVISRSLLEMDLFQHDEKKKCVLFSSYPIWVHAISCAVLIAVNDVFDASGLRLFQCEGILYAIAGRLFFRCENAPVSSRAAHMLWLLAAWALRLKTTWTAKVNNIDMYSLEAVVTAFCLVGALVQMIVFAVPVKNSLWISSWTSKLISRYSLEIYVGHLVLLWIYHIS